MTLRWVPLDTRACTRGLPLFLSDRNPPFDASDPLLLRQLTVLQVTSHAFSAACSSVTAVSRSALHPPSSVPARTNRRAAITRRPRRVSG